MPKDIGYGMMAKMNMRAGTAMTPGMPKIMAPKVASKPMKSMKKNSPLASQTNMK